MNILDEIIANPGIATRINEAFGDIEISSGYMPDKPDTVIGLFEYDATPPEHFFGVSTFPQNIQARVRALDAGTAFNIAKAVSVVLNRYHDSTISILQNSTILDIGRDAANPPRQEYTVNFTIRRKQ